MQEEAKAFNRLKIKRIWIPICIGLSISLFLLVRSMQGVHFVKATASTEATHSWVDANHNGKIDFWDSKEFRLQKQGGTYRQATFSDVFQEANWSMYSFLWLGAALLMMVLRDAAYVLRIRLLTDKQLSWRQCFDVIMLWEFASALLPGTVSGSTVAMFILHKEKISMGRSTAIVIITSLMDNLFFVIFVPILLLFLGKSAFFGTETSALNTGIFYLFVGGYILMTCICCILFMGIFIFPNLVLYVLHLIFSIPFLRRFQRKVQRIGIEVRITAHQFKRYSFVYWLKVVAASFLSRMGRYWVINCLLMAFIPLTFSENLRVFAKEFVLWVMLLASPTPGASGMAEWSFSTLLNEYAPSIVLITLLALLWRLVSYFPYLFIGAFVLPRWLKKKL